MEFTIDRKKWLRGEPSFSELLREKDGKMCCLGIFLNECGMSEEDLESKSTPLAVEVPLPKKARWLLVNGNSSNSDLTKELMEVNDDDDICDNTREKKLRVLFRKKKVIVHFRGR